MSVDGDDNNGQNYDQHCNEDNVSDDDDDDNCDDNHDNVSGDDDDDCDDTFGAADCEEEFNKSHRQRRVEDHFVARRRGGVV